MQCDLEYIPVRLKTLDKEALETFSIGEHLYYRCKPEVLENPYKGISVAEVSHNRSGENNTISNVEDVLYNIVPGLNFEKHDLEICTLEIKDLNQENKYHKEFPLDPDPKITSTATMDLLHDPHPCMYPHSMFRVYLDGELITLENYKGTLNKSPQIRSMIKHELAKMILRKEVSQAN